MIGWFVIPYKIRQGTFRPVRYVAIDDFKWVDGEHWEEWEVPGDQAVVQVSANRGQLLRLARLYPRINNSFELESFLHSVGVTNISHLHKAEWPRFDRPWPENKPSFPQGHYFYRDRVQIGKHKGQPVYAIAGAAWPDTTTLIDDFNRASLGANWTTGAGTWFGDTALSIISSTLLGCASAWGGGYYNAATYGPDIDLIFDYSTAGNGFIGLAARVQTGDPRDFYFYHTRPGESSGSPQTYIARVDNDTETQLGATFLTEYSSGNKAGFEIIGTSNNLKAYKYSGGAWGSALATRSDSTYTTAGYFACQIESTSDRLDNLSGGTVGGGGTTYNDVLSVMKRPNITTIPVLTSNPVVTFGISKAIRTVVNQTLESTVSLMNKKAVTAVINSTIGLVANLGLVKSITSISSSAFETRTDFGVSKSITTIPVSTINGTFGLQSVKGLTNAVTATYETTLYLPLSLRITELGELTLDGVISLPIVKDETIVSAFTFNSVVALQSAKSISDSASLTVDQTIALSRVSNISAVVLANIETTVAMQRSLNLAVIAANTLLASLGLQKQLSIVSLSGLLSEGSISLGRTLAITTVPSVTVDQSITLSKQVNLSNAVNEILFTALALARTLSIGIVGANTLDAAVSFLRSVAIRTLQDVGTQTFENVLSLARTLAISTSTLATLNTNVALQRQDSITLDAVASLFSALSLNKTIAISTLSGLLISLVLSTLGKVNQITDTVNLTIETSIGLNKSQSMEDSNIGTLVNQLSMGKTVSISSIATVQFETITSIGRVLSITIDSGFAFDETLSLQIIQSLTTISDLIQFLGNLPAKLIIGDQTLWLIQANDKVVPSDIIDIDENQSDLHIEDTDNV